MGIESDQLVYDYLSRVGDLAHRQQLASGDRMRLVSGLRNEIDRQRAKYEPETPATVRRILDRLGSPEELIAAVAAAGGGTGSVLPPAPAPARADEAPAVPVQRGPRRFFKGSGEPAVPEQRPSTAALPPHLAGMDELGSDRGEPDWWRVSPTPFGSDATALPGLVVPPGFAGGIELPDILRKPSAGAEDDVRDAETDDEDEDGDGDDAAAAEPVGRTRTVVRALRERRRQVKGAAAAAPAAPEPAAEEAAAARPRPHAFLLLAAAVLVGGAVTGSWLVLAAGWLVAYVSRVLGPGEKKWALFGLPGAVLGGSVVWLWGRTDGRWGAPLAQDAAGEAFGDMWPLMVRLAAGSCALYLLWRSRRH